jgi:hypothetical protein
MVKIKMVAVVSRLSLATAFILALSGTGSGFPKVPDLVVHPKVLYLTQGVTKTLTFYNLSFMPAKLQIKSECPEIEVIPDLLEVPSLESIDTDTRCISSIRAPFCYLKVTNPDTKQTIEEVMVINREGEAPEEDLDNLEVFPKKLVTGYPFLWIINPTNKRAKVKVTPLPKELRIFPEAAKIPPKHVLRMNIVYLPHKEIYLEDEIELVLKAKAKRTYHIIVPIVEKN